VRGEVTGKERGGEDREGKGKEKKRE